MARSGARLSEGLPGTLRALQTREMLALSRFSPRRRPDFALPLYSLSVYSEAITERRVANYERLSHSRLRSVPISRSLELTAYLNGRRSPRGDMLRPVITHELRRFMDNELAMSKASFLYWAQRYCYIQFRTGEGGIQLFAALESQILLIERLGQRELRMWERRDLGDKSFDGLLFFIHKARQLGFSTLVQLLLLHRAIFYSDYKEMTASTDDQKTQDTHLIWNNAYERLPWWMQTAITYREKDRGKWLQNGSYCSLQDFSQGAGLGQGNTWDGFHLTEVAAVDDETCIIALENHFFPAIPRSMRCMGFAESTAQGFGNWWHRSTEQARRGEFGRWGYIFIQWCAEASTYSRSDWPLGWEPDADTLKHATRIERISPEFNNGRTIHLTKEQMYWYETEREAWRKKGSLSTFLTNYPADPEESFQFMEHGAFDSEKVYLLSERADRSPVAYQLVTSKSDRSDLQSSGLILNGPDAPPIYSVGTMDLVPVQTTERDSADPRGLILMFERPQKRFLYSIGVDTAGGIVGWRRQTRKMDDAETRLDNSVASVWYRDSKGLVQQAAEIAGPIAPREFSPYVLMLGRLFAGINPVEMGAPLIIEIQPAASGAQVQQQLQYEFGYYNFYQWKQFNGMEVRETNSWGWVSNQSTVRQLWVKGKDLIEATHLPVRPRSRHLLREMSSCLWDVTRQRGMSMNGFHDDRVSAMLFSLWQLYDWGIAHTPPLQPVRQRDSKDEDPMRIDFQKRDLGSTEELNDAYDEWFARMERGESWQSY